MAEQALLKGHLGHLLRAWQGGHDKVRIGNSLCNRTGTAGTQFNQPVEFFGIQIKDTHLMPAVQDQIFCHGISHYPQANKCDFHVI